MERLPLAAVFDGTPRCNGPVVVQLPVESAHAARTLCAPTLDRHLDRHSLLKLREQQFRLDIFRRLEIAEHRFADAPVAAGILLMPLEFRRTRKNLFTGGECLGNLHRGKALVAEFAAKARTVSVVVVERTIIVPHLPVVHITLGIVLPVVGEAAGTRARRTRPEHPRRIVFRHHAALQFMALNQCRLVVFRVGIGLLEPFQCADAFVVPAPQRDRRMVAEPAQLMGKLHLHFREESVVRRIDGAREHMIVPDEKPEFIADIVEAVLLVLSAAPETDHVHVGHRRAFEKIAVAFRRLTHLERIAGNPVRPLHEKFASVHLHRHPRPLLSRLVNIGSVYDLYFAKPDPTRHLFIADFHREFVEPLLSRAVRPPKRRILDGDAVGNGVNASVGFGDIGENRQLATRKIFIEILITVDIVDLRPVMGDKPHRSAKAGRHLRESPIPSGMAGGLADERLILRPRHVRHRERAPEHRSAPVCLKPCAFEHRPNLVPPGLQRLLRVKCPAGETVRERSEFTAVQIDIGESVGILNLKDNAFPRGKRRTHLERTRELPIRPSDPLHVRLVAPPIGIGHQPGLEKRSVHITGHCRGAWRDITSGYRL